MKSTFILSIILASFVISGNARAADQTVTIYFAGTLMESSYWDKNAVWHPFNEPETVATLHYLQKEEPDYPNHHTGIVEGIRLFDAANPTIADSLGGRGWSAIFQEAYDILYPVISECAGDDPCITLNLVGFSRGAVSTMHFAHRILTNPVYDSIKKKIKKTNIVTFDPVPGDGLMDASIFNLPPNVAYHGFYAVDERSLSFAPVFPKPNLQVQPSQPFTLFTVPGSHETMVGSTLLNGHRDLLQLKSEELRHVSDALKIVATEIMGSSDWGHVRFKQDPAHPELDLDWYDGETDIGLLKQKFSDKLDAMYASIPSNYYFGMHYHSFDLFLESWSAIGCTNNIIPRLPFNAHNPRCSYYYPLGYGNLLGPFALWPIADTEFSFPAIQLRAKIGDNHVIWDVIAAHGSLDVDADFVDYSEDNCPTVANTDQTNFDGDGLGDACDTDDDNDGVADESDICPATPLGEVVVPNGCSLNQLVPCEGPRGTDEPWRNHGQYVSSMTKHSRDFVNMGFLTREERGAIISWAARSSCGKK